MDNTFFSANRDLVRTVEATEAAVGRAYANAVSLRDAKSRTEIRAFGGGAALFAGVDSPMTHVLGAGVNGPVAAAELDEIELFFAERGSATVIDLCPHADDSLVRLITQRPYRLAEFNHVLVRPIEPGEAFPADFRIEVSQVREDGTERWSKAMLEGFSGAAEFPSDALAMVEAFFRLRGGTGFWARLDGREAGTAAMMVLGEVASFFGDATLSEFRNQGCHNALILRRLAKAAESKCRLAMASVLPGSASHRNYERAGFRVLFTRAVVRRDCGAIRQGSPVLRGG